MGERPRDEGGTEVRFPGDEERLLGPGVASVCAVRQRFDPMAKHIGFPKRESGDPIKIHLPQSVVL